MPRPSATFEIVGIEPLDLELYGLSARTAFWRQVVVVGLDVKDEELAAGKDRFGRRLRPIAPYTRKYRRSWTGHADPDAPPLIPAYAESRTRAMLAGRALRDRAQFFWRADPVTGKSWGRILSIHRAGVPKRNLPVRDVIGLSPASLARVQRQMAAWWAKYKKDLAAQEKRPKPGRIVIPRPKGLPQVVYYGTKRPVRPSSKIKVYEELEQPPAPPPQPPAPPPKPAPKPKPPKPPKPPPAPLHAIPAIDKAMAAQRRANAQAAKLEPSSAYATLRTKFPDLIPPGPIEDRIGKYTAGDAKRKAIVERNVKYHAEILEHMNRRAEVSIEQGDLGKQQARLLDKYASQGLPIPAEVSAQVDALQKQIDALQVKRDALFAARTEVRKKRDSDVQKILELAGPRTTFANTDVPRGYVASNKPGAPLLDPMDPAGPTAAKVKTVQEWLGKVTAAGETDRISTRIGEAVDARAHFWDSKDHMQVKFDEKEKIIAHEYGHAIEARTRTGTSNALDRGLEFLKYRVGNEPLTDLHAKFGRGDPGEMGRKDQFTTVFPEYSAYYAGKDYGRDGTEILSMGIEKLYDDPIGFAEQDPEYFKYVLGILDGSLR
jgi:hypothetical protein